MKQSEIVRRIATIDLKIQKYRRNNRLLYYNTGEKRHLKQLAFHKCKKRNRWVFGGNRTGKTECGAAETAWLLRGNHPYKKCPAPVTGWCVSLTREVQREVAQSKLLDYLNPDWIVDAVMSSGKAGNPRGGVIDYLTVRHVSGGISKLCFKSCEMGREKFQGASLDFVWFDEEPPSDVYAECRMRILDRKGEIFGTMTPLKGMTWVYDEIYLNVHGDDEVWYETMEWRDNPFLDPGEVERLSRSMDSDELESRRFGLFKSEGGPVYPEFDQTVNVVEPFDIPAEWQDRLSIDPGLNNPLSCHWYAVDGDGNVFVVAEHYAAGKEVAWHARKILEKCADLNWHRNSSGRVEALIDSAATQRTLASPTPVSELFYEHGIAVDTRVNKQLFSGIARVKEYLSGAGGPRLYIFSTCTNLIREIKGYYWTEGDVPKKKDDHALDELRYYLCSRPRPYKPPPEKKSELLRYKERLARRTRRGGV